MIRLFAAMLALALATPAIAQGELSPAQVLERVREAYRAGPIEERIELRFDDGEQTERETIRLRIDAAARRPRLRLDLGDLAIFARSGPAQPDSDAERAEGELRIHLRSDQGRYVSLPIERLTLAQLGRHLPPIGLPQLEWAIGQSDGADTLLARPVDWQSATRADSRQGGAAVRLTGLTPAGVATLVFDPGTWCLRSASLPLEDEQLDSTVRLQVEPLDPLDPARWAPDTAGHPPLAGLAELRPGRGPLQPGDPFPAGWLLDVEGEPWPLAEVARASHGAERFVLLVAFRHPRGGEGLERTLVLADAGVTVAEQLRVDLRTAGPEVRVDIRVVPVFDIGDFSRRRLERLAGRWLAPDGETAVLWMLAPGQTLDRLAPGAQVAIVAIDSSARLVDAASIDANADHLDEVLSAMSEALRESAADADAGAPTPHQAPGRSGSAAPKDGRITPQLVAPARTKRPIMPRYPQKP